MTDTWAAGDQYEPYVGRWSRLVAKEFVDWLDAPARSVWLDVGCGTGALTGAILEHADPEVVNGIDPSAGFIEYAHRNVADPRATFDVGDAQALPVETASTDAAVSGLVLNFVPDPGRAVEEMVRTTRADGIVGAYVWDYAEKMELMRYFWDAAVALDPAARDLDEGPRFPICHQGPLRDLFAGAGVKDVDVRAIDVPTVFRDFDDYWTPFLGAQGPAPGYAMSLTDERRSALRDRIRSALPVEEDGSIHLVARAWAAKGRSGRQ